jgi:hypothetical protein
MRSSAGADGQQLKKCMRRVADLKGVLGKYEARIDCLEVAVSKLLLRIDQEVGPIRSADETLLARAALEGYAAVGLPKQEEERDR